MSQSLGVHDRAPLRVYWEVTRACDLCCRHCRADAVTGADPRELTTSDGFRLIERLTGFGEPLPRLVLTGGDALKRWDLFSLIGFARALGFGVSVAPSATPLLTLAALRGLRDAGVEAISLSLDGADPERHDALRGVPGCFDRTIQAARVAREIALPLQVNTLVCAATLPQMSAIHALVTELGAQRWSLFFLIAVGRGQALAPVTPAAGEHLLGWLADRAGRPGPIVATTEAPHFRRVLLQRAHGERARPATVPGRHAHGERARPATVPGRHAHGAAGIRDGNGIMFIGHTGLLYPSGFYALPAGDARQEDPVEIYRRSPAFRALRDPDGFRGRCGRCEFRHVCGGSRARALACTGDPLAEDPLCPYEPRAAVRGIP